MKFRAKTEAELKSESNSRASSSLWPRGVYDFEVVRASNEVSKNDNDMIKLTLRVYDASGNTQTVWDYLLDALQEKLLHACEAFGVPYTPGEEVDLDASEFEGKAGQVVLYIQKGKDGYPDKNAVADYVRQVAKASVPPPKGKPVMAGAGSDLDDEIPF